MQSKLLVLTFLLSSCVSMDRNISNIFDNKPHSPFQKEEVLIETDTFIKILAKDAAYINMLKKNTTTIYVLMSEKDKERLISNNSEIRALTRERLLNISLLIELRSKIYIFEKGIFHNQLTDLSDSLLYGKIDLTRIDNTIDEYKKNNSNKRFKIITEEDIDKFK